MTGKAFGGLVERRAALTFLKANEAIETCVEQESEANEVLDMPLDPSVRRHVLDIKNSARSKAVWSFNAAKIAMNIALGRKRV